MNAKLVKLVGTAALIIIVVAGYFFVVSPYLQEKGRLSGQLTDAQATNEQLKLQVASIGRNKDLAEKVRDYDAELNDRFPSTAGSDELRSQIYAAASEAGVDINVNTTVPVIVQGAEAPASDPAAAEDDNIDAQAAPDEAPAPTANNMAEIGLSITAEGSFDAVSEFLTLFSEIDRGILVDGISVSSSGQGKDEEEPTYSLTISAKTFLYRTIVHPDDAVEVAPEDAVEDDAQLTNEDGQE